MPVPSYPIRGYETASNTSNNVSNNTLSVETDQDTPQTPQVETDDTPVHVEMEDAPAHVEMSPPSKGILVTCSSELKKYK